SSRSRQRAQARTCAWSNRASGPIRSRPSAVPRPGGSSSLKSWSRSWRGQAELCRVSLRLVIREVLMNTWIRQIHRWLSIAFTVTVIANFAAMGLGEPPAWVVYSPLLPLFLLLFTGLYMFVLPYATKWRIGRGIDAPKIATR